MIKKYIAYHKEQLAWYKKNTILKIISQASSIYIIIEKGTLGARAGWEELLPFLIASIISTCLIAIKERDNKTFSYYLTLIVSMLSILTYIIG
jgi:hypothetical protein